MTQTEYAIFREAAKLMTPAELTMAIEIADRADAGDQDAYKLLRSMVLETLRSRGTGAV